jgi:membrane dipeptidase
LRIARFTAIALVLLSCTREQPKPKPEQDCRLLHERLLTLDTHLDTPANFAHPAWDIMKMHSVAGDLSQVDYPRLMRGGLDGGFWAIYTEQGPRTKEGEQKARASALRTALRIQNMVARQQRSFALALRADDAREIAAHKKRVVYLSMENGYPLGHDLSLLTDFYELGVRMFGPVHFLNNDLGDSSTDAKGAEWQGLSPLGKELVAEANRLGIVLDASHASDAVLDQMLALSKAPIILSHSGVKAVYDHPRNVDDARLRQLAAQGGVIQLNSLSEYLIQTPANPARKQAFRELFARYGRLGSVGPEARAELAKARAALEQKYPIVRASFDDFMRHLLHALTLVGPEHVGIGADWDGGGGVIGMEDVADLPKITCALQKAGYSEADLANIWSGNVLRVLRAAEQVSASWPARDAGADGG